MNKTSNTKLLIFLLSFDLLLTIFLALFTEDSRKYYKEGQLVTIYSGLKLFTTSLICWKIFKYKEGILSLKQLKNPIFIWLIISAGFLFLALDELVLIHESIDKLIHYIFSMEETSLTDRIDDLIILVYGLIGIYILYRYKDEILKYRFIIKYLVISFILLFIMVIADVLTNKSDILIYLFSETGYKAKKDVIDYIEEITKLFSESILIVAFYSVLTYLRKLSF